MKFSVGDDVDDVAEQGPLMPLRLVVVADLVPRDEHNAGASAPEGTIRLEPGALDDLFQRLRPRIAVDVPSVLMEGRATRVDLAPTSLKSFRPDGLCAEVPLLRSLLDGRLVLERLRDGAISEGQARVELDRLWSGSPFVRQVLGLLQASVARPEAAAPAAAPAQSAGAGLEGLLDLVDLTPGAGGSSARRDEEAAPAAPAASAPSDVSSKMSELIAAVAGFGKGERKVRPAEAIGHVDRALGAQLGAILQHPEVRRLERAYRGLALLVERARSHRFVHIDAVSARPHEADAALRRAARAAVTGEPVSAAVVDVEIDGSAASFARLEAIADVAEAYAVPTVVNATDGLLGAELGVVNRMDYKGSLFEAPARAPWRATAGKPALRWVTLAANPILGRAGYTRQTSRVRQAELTEQPSDDASLVWIAPAYAVGSLIVGSYQETNWPCRITGARSGVVENLPVREVVGDDGEVAVAIPTRAFVSTESQKDLAALGVLALASAPNSDAAYVMSAPTAYVTPAKRTYDSSTTEPEQRLPRVSLGDQLFVARVVQLLRSLCGKLPADADPAEVQPVVEGALAVLFEGAPPSGPEAKVTAQRGEHGTTVAVELRPRRFLGVAMEELSLEMPLG